MKKSEKIKDSWVWDGTVEDFVRSKIKGYSLNACAGISPKYVAEYRRKEKNAYSREPTVHRSTILHEFFHHLTNLNVVLVPKDQEEKLADRFARVFLQRAGWNQ